MAYCHQSKDTASLQCSQATYNGQREYTELTAASTYRAAKNKDGQEKKNKKQFSPHFWLKWVYTTVVSSLSNKRAFGS